MLKAQYLAPWFTANKPNRAEVEEGGRGYSAMRLSMLLQSALDGGENVLEL